MRKLNFFYPVMLSLSAIFAGGCSSTVAQSADAKIQHSQDWAGAKYYDLDLPHVSLAQTGTYDFKVRNIPDSLAGRFRYSLDMNVPINEGDDGRPTPWSDATVTLIFRRLDGTEAYRQTLGLGHVVYSTTNRLFWRDEHWNLGPEDFGSVPITDTSFDLVVIVDRPSKRACDHLILTGSIDESADLATAAGN